MEYVAVISKVGQVTEHRTLCAALGIDFIDEGFATHSVAFDLSPYLPLAASVGKCCHLPLLGRTGLGQACFYSLVFFLG